MLMSGGADPLTTGMMYCELVCAAQGLALYDVASEWTEVMERWRVGAARRHQRALPRPPGRAAAGVGAVRRAEAEALGACDELRPWMRREFGWPLHELGNIRLRKGDLAGAEEAFDRGAPSRVVAAARARARPPRARRRRDRGGDDRRRDRAPVRHPVQGAAAVRRPPAGTAARRAGRDRRGTERRGDGTSRCESAGRPRRAVSRAIPPLLGAVGVRTRRAVGRRSAGRRGCRRCRGPDLGRRRRSVRGCDGTAGAGRGVRTDGEHRPGHDGAGGGRSGIPCVRGAAARRTRRCARERAADGLRIVRRRGADRGGVLGRGFDADDHVPDPHGDGPGPQGAALRGSARRGARPGVPRARPRRGRVGDPPPRRGASRRRAGRAGRRVGHPVARRDRSGVVSAPSRRDRRRHRGRDADERPRAGRAGRAGPGVPDRRAGECRRSGRTRPRGGRECGACPDECDAFDPVRARPARRGAARPGPPPRSQHPHRHLLLLRERSGHPAHAWRYRTPDS
jgi:hypothetical protein